MSDTAFLYDYAIVGCGVFGLSTAWELSKRFPDKKIVAFDAFEVPSKWSAANDYNKIIRAEYSDIVYARLALEALKQWESDPVLKPHFIKSGRFTLSPLSSVNSRRLVYENKGVENMIKLGVAPGKVSVVKSHDKLSEIAPEYKDSTLFSQYPNAEIKYNPDAGFGVARDSLVSVYKLALANGVKFVFGREGKIVAINQVNDVELVAESGTKYSAKQVVVAMGASTGYLVKLQNQISSTGLFVSHLKLTDEQYIKYKNLPIFFSAEFGYFFPPDPQNRRLKVAITACDCRNTLFNALTQEKSSLPRYSTEFPTDTFPKAKCEDQVRKLISLTLPELANNPLVESKCCWISDTVNSDFLVDYSPDFKSNRVLVACGDSGHGYKFLGNIGRYIADKLENNLETELDQKWRWKAYPQWPENMNFSSRANRDHLEITEIKEWYIEENPHL